MNLKCSLNYLLLSKSITTLTSLCILILSCSSTENKDAKYIISAFESDHINNEVAFSIPLNGCSGCAQNSLLFAQKHSKKTNLYLILISDSVKEAVYYKNEYFSNKKHITILSSQEALAHQFDINFPSYYLLRKTGIEKTIINAQSLQQSFDIMQEFLK